MDQWSILEIDPDFDFRIGSKGLQVFGPPDKLNSSRGRQIQRNTHLANIHIHAQELTFDKTTMASVLTGELAIQSVKRFRDTVSKALEEVAQSAETPAEPYMEHYALHTIQQYGLQMHRLSEVHNLILLQIVALSVFAEELDRRGFLAKLFGGGREN